MADNEDDSSSSRTIRAAEPNPGAAEPNPGAAEPNHGAAEHPPAFQSSQPSEDSSLTVAGAESSQPGESLPTGSAAQLADLLQSCPEEQSILLGTEFTTLGPDPDLVNTTIIYVQPDGSLLEGSGLTPDEQQALLDQLTKQQIVQVSDTEAAQLLLQSQLVKTIPVHNTALDPSQLQQVINQVTKSQQQVHVQIPQQTPKQKVQVPKQTLTQKVQVPQQGLKQVQVQTTTQNNASQQLKSVAQQVAMQSGSLVQVVQKKSEPVRIQIQVPPKQDVKSVSAPQQKSVAVSHPQVKLSPNGSSAQIIHIQPVMGQQGQQFFLQQNPGDPPIQLLLQSPAPIVGSLLPLVHKLTGQTTSAGTTSSLNQKPAMSPIRLQTSSLVKTLPTSTKTKSVPLIKTPGNGTTTAASKSPVKPPAVITAVPVQTATPAAVQPASVALPPVAPPLVTLPPVVKDRDREKEKREKEKKAKKREKRAVKVQTRSGRVSRPPKYKAKDYKFIKTEDLADSHQSDSDDYSDMSMEEEGEMKDGPDPGTSLTYSHKSRSHHCQTCDKAYIGPGGLNRHYKLNPTHGEPGLPGNTPHPLRDDSQSQDTTTEGVREEEEKKNRQEEDKPAATATNRGGPVVAVGLKGLHPRGPGRPRGRGRGRGRSLGPPPKVTVGLVSRRGRRGRPPKLAVAMVTSEQQMERRRDRLQELVEQCEDEELMDIVLPRLTKVLSLWELLLAKVEGIGQSRTLFPDIYREFESLQAQVRQTAQDYIISPQGSAIPLEVRNIEVARSLGILDEVNMMKVVPGASPSSSLTNKNVRYMENSKMLPPSKRFKMENSVPVHQNGIEMQRTGGTPVTSVAPETSSLTPVTSVAPETSSLTPVTSVAPETSPLRPSKVSPLLTSAGSKLLTTSTESASSSSDSTSAKMASTQAPLPVTPMEVTQGEDQVTGSLQTSQDEVLSCSHITAQMKELQKALGSSPETTADSKKPDSSSTPTTESSLVQSIQSSLFSQLQQRESSQSKSGSEDLCEPKELHEGQEIYIQTEGLTVQLAEPGLDQIVIVNGPDGTTMHIQTPEGVPLEAVQALLGIEASDRAKTSK